MAKKKFPLDIPLRAIDKVTKPMRKMRKGIDKIFAPLRRVRSGLRELGAVAGVKRLSRNLKKAVGGAMRLGRAVGRVSGRLALMGVTGIAAVGMMLRGYSKAGDLIGKTSKRIGIGVEVLQEYRFAAGRAGLSQEIFDKATTKYVRTLGDMKSGMGTLNQLLKAENPQLLANLKAQTDTGEALGVILDAIDKIEDPMKKASLASAAFGRAGVDIISLAGEGAEGIKALRLEARRLGVVMTVEQTKAAEASEDAWLDFSSALGGIKNVLGSGLTPMLTKLMGKLTELLVKYRPAIQAWAKSFAVGLPKRLLSIREGIVKFGKKLKPLIDFGKRASETFGGMNIILGVLGAIIFGPVIGALGALVPVIFSLGAAILTTPIGWILAGLFALVVAVKFVMKHWGKITGFFSTVWDSVVAKFNWAWGKIKKVGAWLLTPVDWIISGWGKLTGFFSNLWGGIVAMFKSSVGWIYDKLTGLVDWLPSWVKKKLGFSVDATVTGDPGNLDLSPANIAARGGGGTAAVRISFDDLPPGTRIQDEGNDGVPLDLDLGYASPAL